MVEYFGTFAVCAFCMTADVHWKPKRAFHAGTEMDTFEAHTWGRKNGTYNLAQYVLLHLLLNRGRWVVRSL